MVAEGLDSPKCTVETADGKTLIVGRNLDGAQTDGLDIQPGTETLFDDSLGVGDLGDAVRTISRLDAEDAVLGRISDDQAQVDARRRGRRRRLTARALDSMPIRRAARAGRTQTLRALRRQHQPDECRAKRSARIDTIQVAVAGAVPPLFGRFPRLAYSVLRYIMETGGAGERSGKYSESQRQSKIPAIAAIASSKRSAARLQSCPARLCVRSGMLNSSIGRTTIIILPGSSRAHWSR